MKWADSHEGGLQAFVAQSQNRMELAVRKARYKLAKVQGNKATSTLESLTSEEAGEVINSNPEELPVAARSLEGDIDEKSQSAIASVIKSRKERLKE